MSGGATIVVVGSVNVDLIVRSERLPRPGETVVGGEFASVGGGKGANQALAARRLGADVRFIARIGDDSAGRLALAAFAADGLPATWITVDRTSPTGVALIMVDRQGENLISVASGANLRLTAEDVRRAESAFVGARVLLAQLEVPPATVREALATGRAHGLITVLNPAPARPMPNDLLALVDWLTPNAIEAAALTGREVRDQRSAAEAGRDLLARGAGHVVLTLGRDGALVVEDEQVRLVPALPVDAVDATAAGDAFSAALAVGLAHSWPIDQVLRFASAAGALATTRLGAQSSLPTGAEVWSLLAAGRR